MTVGKTLLAIGLFFDILGTLFISLDVLKGQGESLGALDFVGWVMGFERNHDSYGDERTNRALGMDVQGDPEFLERQRKLKELQEGLGILNSAEEKVRSDYREKLQNDLNNLLKGFRHRRPRVFAAIYLVAVGGVLEFVGGVIFG